MNNNNQRTDGPSGGGGGEAAGSSVDWRARVHPDVRHRVVNIVFETIGKHMPVYEGTRELRRVAIQYENRVYSKARSQEEYLRKVSSKMLALQSQSQDAVVNELISNFTDSDSTSGGVSAEDTAKMLLLQPQSQNTVANELISSSTAIDSTSGGVSAEDTAKMLLLQSQSQNTVANDLISNSVAGGNTLVPRSMPLPQTQLHQQIPSQIHNSLKTVESQNSAGGLGQWGLSRVQGQQDQHTDFQKIAQNSQLKPIQKSQIQQQQSFSHSNQMRLGEQLQQPQKVAANYQQRSLSQESHRQQLGHGSNVPGWQRQPQQVRQHLHGSQSVNSGPQTNQNPSVQMLQKPSGQRQTPRSSQALRSGKPPLPSHIQSQPSQLSQQMGLQQNQSQMQPDKQRKSQQASSSLQQQNVIDQRKQQRIQSGTSSSSVDSASQPRQTTEGMQEKIYQKIQTLKEMYLDELKDMLQSICARIQQQPESMEQIRKKNAFRDTVERLVTFLQIPKNQVVISDYGKLKLYKRYILKLSDAYRRRKQRDDSISMEVTQPTLMDSAQGNFSSGQANAINSMQQVAVRSLQQSSISSEQASFSSSQQEKETEKLRKIQLHQMQPKSMEKQMIQITKEPRNMNISDNNDMMQQGVSVKSGVPQPPSKQYPHHQNVNSRNSVSTSSSQPLQTMSSQILQHSSMQIDQRNLTKSGRSLQSAALPLAQSPSTPRNPSSVLGDGDEHVPAVPMHSNEGNLASILSNTTTAGTQSHVTDTPAISASTLPGEVTDHGDTHGNALVAVSGNQNEQPIERLIRAVRSASPEALTAAAVGIRSVVSLVNGTAGSEPGNGSRAAIGEDLVAMTNSRIRARNCLTQDGIAGIINSLPSYIASSGGNLDESFKQSEMPGLLSSSTPGAKRPKHMDKHALLAEMERINQQLVDTVISFSNEDNDLITPIYAAEKFEGTIVKCSYMAVALSPSLKFLYTSGCLSNIQPLRMLVPSDYPNSSPQFLDEFPAYVSDDCEDFSLKAKYKFWRSIRSLEIPMSLWDITKTWDICARGVLCEYAEKTGGGTFSSKYGTWEDC